MLQILGSGWSSEGSGQCPALGGERTSKSEETESATTSDVKRWILVIYKLASCFVMKTKKMLDFVPKQ